MGGVSGGVFCRRPWGATALPGLAGADCTAFAADDWWKRASHFYTRSDHVDWLSLSCLYACLLPAHPYTTFEMASIMCACPFPDNLILKLLWPKYGIKDD